MVTIVQNFIMVQLGRLQLLLMKEKIVSLVVLVMLMHIYYLLEIPTRILQQNSMVRVGQLLVLYLLIEGMYMVMELKTLQFQLVDIQMVQILLIRHFVLILLELLYNHFQCNLIHKDNFTWILYH